MQLITLRIATHIHVYVSQFVFFFFVFFLSIIYSANAWIHTIAIYANTWYISLDIVI